MNKALLISVKTLKETTIIGINVEEKPIQQAIFSAQDLGLQSIIGTALIDKLYQMVNANAVTGYYKTLMDQYVQPYLQYKVLADIIPLLSYKLRNEGMVTTTSEQVQQMSLAETQNLQSQNEAKAASYANLMSKWLCANCSHIPEFHEQRDCADVHANRLGYDTGIYIPNI